jgi:prevent-host-death family protein
MPDRVFFIALGGPQAHDSSGRDDRGGDVCQEGVKTSPRTVGGPPDAQPQIDMLDARNRSYYSGHIDRGIVMQKMAAAQFKAQCLAVMDQVAQSGRPVVITKHGKPVVKLVPANEGEDEIFGALAGIARIKGDIENTVPVSDWGVE